MSRLIAAALLLLFAVPSIQAQQLRLPSADALADRPTRAATLELLQREDSREAIEAFHSLKAAGELPVVSDRPAAKVGSAASFNVWNFENSEYESRDFTLELEDARFNVWVETEALTNNLVTTEDLEALRQGLAEATPAASFDASQGIIAIDEIIFGDPPNVDGDSKTDILFVDVRDGWQPGQGFTAGFVDPRDIGPPNSRDILYLDIEPTVRLLGIEEALTTAAHEYQHLIHLNYDRFEELFINEGLSSWAEAVTGYGPESPTHLGSVNELQHPLFEWRNGGGPNINDYRRGALWTAYLAERMGTELTGSLTRESGRGATGIQRVLNNVSLDLDEVAASYHIANFINRRDVEERYGYASPFYQSLSSASAVTYDGQVFSKTSPTTPAAISPGAVMFHSWESVADISIRIDVADDQSNPATARTRIAPHVILEFENGAVEVREAPAGLEQHYFQGSFSRVTLAVPHINLSLTDNASNRVSFTFDADWSPANPDFAETEVIYDDGRIHMTDPSGPVVEAYTFSPGGSTNFEEDSRATNRFEVDPGSLIGSVSVAPMFLDDFGSATGTRDYRLTIWADDGSGGPGDELFSLDRTDGRPGSLAVQGDDFVYLFDDIDFGPYRDQIGALPGAVHIGFENVGSDDNHVVAPVSAYAAGDSPSWFYLAFSDGSRDWRAFSSLQTQSGEFPLRDKVVPVRASFLIPLATADEAEFEVPRSITLEANYPNPFNPETTIAFTLDAAQQVRLSVFDVTGREVAVLQDGLAPAGRHESRFSGQNLASGLYLYRLQTASGSLARPMLLLK